MSRQSRLGACCASLIFLFLYAATSKLANIEAYQFDMTHQVFKPWMVTILLPVIPVLEIGISIMLYFDRTRMVGLIASLILMVLFTSYTFLVMICVFDHVPCSCGGIIRRLSWRQHLFLNLFFVGIAIYGLWLHSKIKKQMPSSVALT